VLRPFRRTLRGYSTDDVDEHLRLVRGWFTLAGFDELLAARRDDLLRSALGEAEAIVEDARREAETIIERARLEAKTVLEDAMRRREATTAAAQEHLASLKSLASIILEEPDAPP
jgi:cell division septum initiation protein DivIVA